MQYRQFGRTDLHLSEIGFGAWAIGGNAKVAGVPIGWGPANDAISEGAIRTALDNGINFFDTADFYGLGHSEELLGAILQERKEVIIATKVGQRNMNDTIVTDYSTRWIIEACEASLRRLRREVIDYYQLHSARVKHLQQGDCIEAMQILQKQGKIRYWGLSLNTFYPDAEADWLMENNIGDGLQLVYNLINQRAKGVIEKAGAAGYGIIARMPLQFGLLTGKFSPTTSFKKDDHRNFRLTPEIMQKAIAILEKKVWPIAEQEGISRTALAMNFILSSEKITTVIAGMRTRKQVIENVAEIKKPGENELNYLHALADEDWKELVALMERQG